MILIVGGPFVPVVFGRFACGLGHQWIEKSNWISMGEKKGSWEMGGQSIKARKASYPWGLGRLGSDCMGQRPSS